MHNFADREHELHTLENLYTRPGSQMVGIRSAQAGQNGLVEPIRENTVVHLLHG